MENFRLTVLDPNDGIVYNEVVTLGGGDIYELKLAPIHAFLNRDAKNNYAGLPLDNEENNDFDLGRLEDIYTYHSITLLTQPGDITYDINIYIRPFLYNSHVADLVWLALAEDEDELPEDVADERWVRRVNIQELHYLEPKKIHMRLQKDFTQVMLFDTTRYKFKVIIE
jgi:hypothetical protein